MLIGPQRLGRYHGPCQSADIEVQRVVHAGTDRPRLLMVATVAVTVSQFLRPYAEHFRSLGWQVDEAANGMTAVPTGADGTGSPGRVHELPLSRSVRDVRGLGRGWRAIRTVIRATRPDIVHVHTPVASFLVRLAVRRMAEADRPAVIYTAHGFHFHGAGSRLANAAFLLAERVAGRWTDRLIVINDEDEAAARRHRIVPTRRLVRMPGIGLNTAAYAPESVDAVAAARDREALGLRADVPYFVVVGELNPNKRQADAIEALAKMADGDAMLVLVGSGPLRPRLEALAAEQGVADRVRFSGLIADVPAILAGATALVSTSAREGLSRSVMEALSLEVPVVASSARGNRELVADSGRIFDTGDVATLAAALDWFVEHRSEARSLGRAGRRRMVERYDLAPLIRRHEALYAEVLAERSHRTGSA
jgi:glycosyltransferase involved in cell wall biosynthesis